MDRIASIKPVVQQHGVPLSEFRNLEKELDEMVKERDIMISEFNNDMNLKCQESEHFQQEVKKLSAEN